MSERGSHLKSKSVNLQEISEVTKNCIRYCEPEGKLDDFMTTAIVLENELKEKEHEEIVISKEICNAINKAMGEGLIRIIRIVNTEAGDSKIALKRHLESFYSVCWVFTILLKKGNSQIKVDKQIIEKHIKEVIYQAIHALDPQDFLLLFFVLINFVMELVQSKKKRIDLSDRDLAIAANSIVQPFLYKFISEKGYSGISNVVYNFEGHLKKVSLFSTKYQDSIPTDLVHYLLKCVEQLMQHEISIAFEFTRTVLPNILVYLLDISEFNSSVLSTITDLSIQKYLISLSILKDLCASSNKLDVPRNFLKSNSEKIKNIFFYALLSYSKYYFVMNGTDFEKDDGVLGKLYKSLYDILSTIATNTELEGFPLLLFSVILQKDISQELLSKPPQIQAYTLQFIEKYLQTLGKKKPEAQFANLKECRLIEILFSGPFFQVDSSRHDDIYRLGHSANLSWEKIWDYLMQNKMSLEWISNSIVLSIRFNQSDIVHMLKINKWIQEQFDFDSELVDFCIKHGLLEEIFNVIALIKRSQSNEQALVEFFLIIKYILNMYDNHELRNSGMLMDLIMQDNFLYDPECSDLCMTCMAQLLRFKNDSNYWKFGKLLKEVKNISIKIKLLNSIQEILKNNSTKKQCQEGFLKADTLSTLKEIITDNYEADDQLIMLWVSVLECVRFLIEDNAACKKHLQDFDFGAVANTIRSPLYAKIRTEIYLKSIESLLFILFETNNIGTPQMRNVKTPEVIPLVVELLSDCDYLGSAKEYFEHISVGLDDCYNAAHFANSRTTDLLLDALERSSSPFLLKFIGKALPLVICHHITPQELKKIIEIARRNRTVREKQMLLYHCISSAVKNSLGPTEHYKFHNHTCLSPTRYFCFREAKSLLQCQVPHSETLLPLKEFSIFMWVFPDSLSRQCILLEFLGPNFSRFIIGINAGNITVEYFKEELVFVVMSTETIEEKQWSLIGISLKAPAKLTFSSDKPEIEIFINSEKCSTKIQQKVTRPKENFSILTLGNSENAQNGYKGRVISFFITKKALTLGHFKEIYYLSFQYNLGFNPDAISTSEDIKSDKNVLRTIFDNITFQWHPRGTTPELLCEKIDFKSECERFNGVTILESIAANGGLKIFLPLIKEWADVNHDNEGIVVLLDLIADVCSAQAVESILDNDFFDLLVFVLEESIEKTTVQLVETLIKIVGHLEWNKQHQEQALKCLFFNKKLWSEIDSECSVHYLGTISLHIRVHFTCNLQTLYSIFDQLTSIKNSCYESFIEIWEKIIPNDIENENIDGILILIFKMKDYSPKLLRMFLEMLSKKKFKRECFEQMIWALLHFMENIKKGKIQAALLQFIRKLTEELCVEIQKEKKNAVSSKDEYEFIINICNSIDKRLERNIKLETFYELLNFFKNSFVGPDKKRSEKFINFFTILAKRLPDCDRKEELASKICEEVSDFEFCKMLFDRDNFPGWLISLYVDIPKEMGKIALEIFEKCSAFKGFNKLRNFLISIASQFKEKGLKWAFEFYRELMLKLKGINFTPVSYDSSSSKSGAVLFLGYLGVFEDLLNIDFTGSLELDLDSYISIIDLIFTIGLEMQLISSTFPPLPPTSFELQHVLLNEHPNSNPSENAIILREGGYLRLILKFLFIGLNVSQDERLINLLKLVLKQGAPTGIYLTLAKEQQIQWQSRFFGANIEKYTDAYSYPRDKNEDSLYSTLFLTQYVIAECSEILGTESPNPILSFLIEFMSETDAFAHIDTSRITDFEVENFFRLIKDNKFWVHSTARSRTGFHERNKNIDLLSQYVSQSNLPDSKNFASEMKEILSRCRKEKAKNSLLNLLNSQEWLTKVHFYLIAMTSMKLNFISTCVKYSEQTFTEAKQTDELYEKINRFIDGKKEIFDKAISIYEQKLDRSRKMADKKYQNFCKDVEKVKKILNDTDKGSYRIKHVIDGLGRMPFLEHDSKSVAESPIPKSRLSIVNIPQMPLPKIIKENSSEVTEETETQVGNESDPEESQTSAFQILEEVERMDCERIKINKSIFGFIEISQDYLLYVSEGKEKPKSELYFGSALEFTLIPKKTEKVWETADIKEVFPRRFTHRHTAFEVYLHSGKSVYFNVFSEENCEKALSLMNSWGIKGVNVVKEPKKLLPKYKKIWQKGSMSNLEYLLILNKFASRSFNDISQYPVFPWVLKNYQSEDLRLEDDSCYRNLGLPIGAQSEEGRNEARRKFSMFVDEEVLPFHYGSHYSSAGIVLHYLVRLDPFTELARNLQGGTFDVADRLFYSIESAWESGQGTTGDVKELIPEMFYLPEILVNINHRDFGTRQDSKPVKDVELPKWAQSAVEFIIKHRKALESPYVSAHLHEWIDLIFGNKQKGKLAEDFLNTFCSITYEDSYNKLRNRTRASELDSLQGYVEQIVHFGQTPIQLFTKPHPMKEMKTKNFDIYERWKISPNSIEIDEIRGTGQILSVFTNSKSIWTVKSLKSFLYLSRETSPDNKVFFKLEGVRDMKLNEWEEAVQWKYTLNSSANSVLERNDQQYCLWGEDMLVSGFHIDNSFKVHLLNASLFRSVHHHAGLVTCVIATLDYLFTGSMDTSIVSWNAPHSKSGFSTYKIYLGHSEAIRQLAVQGNYQVLLSLSVNGIVLIHEIKSAQCLRKLSMKSPIKLISVSEHGLIALYVQNLGLKIVTVNAQDVCEVKENEPIRCMKFSKSGDYLNFATVTRFCFFEVIEPKKFYEKKIEEEGEFAIQTFCASFNKEFFTIISTSNCESKVITLGKIREKKGLHPI